MTLRERFVKVLTRDEDLALHMSHGHHNRMKETLSHIMPEYKATWEAGRSCGYHAGILDEAKRREHLTDCLVSLALAMDELTQTRSFGDKYEACEVALHKIKNAIGVK